MVALARTTGAAVNVWQVGADRVAPLVAEGVEVTWGGPVGDTVEAATTTLTEVAAAGASWAVCAWPDSLEVVAEAAAAIG
jgi:hypothetical protein